MAVKKRSSGSSKKRVSKLRKLGRLFNPRSLKGGMALFALVFAVSGAGYYVYQSFAATSAEVVVMDKTGIYVAKTDGTSKVNVLPFRGTFMSSGDVRADSSGQKIAYVLHDYLPPNNTFALSYYDRVTNTSVELFKIDRNAYPDASINNLAWVSSDKLLFDITNYKGRSGVNSVNTTTRESTLLLGGYRNAQIKPGGTNMLVVKDGGGLYLTNTRGVAPKLIGAKMVSASWAPDGSKFITINNESGAIELRTESKLINRLMGSTYINYDPDSPKIVAWFGELGTLSSYLWSPTGSYIAHKSVSSVDSNGNYLGGGHVYRCHTTTAKCQRLSNNPSGAFTPLNAVFGKDGKILFTSRSTETRKTSLYSIDTSTLVRTKLHEGQDNYDLHYAPIR